MTSLAMKLNPQPVKGATSLPGLLLKQADEHGDRLAMRHKARGIWHEITWHQQALAVAGLARALAARGVGPGLAVAVTGDNRPEIYQVMLAVHVLGAATVPYMPQPSPGEALRDCLAGVTVTVCETPTQAAMATRGLALEILLAEATAKPGDLDLLRQAAGRLDAGEVAFHLFTPGIHGDPARVSLAHDEIVAAARALGQGLGLGHGDAALACMPVDTYADVQMSIGLHLVAGLVINCPEGPGTLLSDLREVAPQILIGTPRLFEQLDDDISRRMARAGRVQRAARMLGRAAFSAPLMNAMGLRRCKAAVVTGDAMAPAAMARLKSLGLPLRDGYGLTQAGGIAALDGRPLPGITFVMKGGEVSLRLADGAIVPTGDHGRLDGAGNLHLEDPAPLIEARLRDQPEIDRAAVHPRADGGFDALITLDMETVGRFAEARGIAFSGPAALAQTVQVQDLIGQRVAALGFAIDFRIVEALDAGTAEVTLDGRLRRDRLWRRLSVVEDAGPVGAGEAAAPDTRTIGEVVLSVAGISLSFGGIKALTDVSLEVRKGEVLSIIGPNGAGKTSLLNVLNGVYHPQAGRIVCNGVERRRMRASLAPRQGIGRTFQNVALFKGMSVLDNVMVGRATRFRSSMLAKALRMPWTVREEEVQREAVERILAFLDLESVRKTLVAGLPYGVQKRVELARALSAEPSILLLDEPMAGMTYEEKQDMCRFIRAANQELGTTIILIEHDVGVVMGMSDRVVVLNYGIKIADGTPDEVRADPDVVAAYLGPSANVAAVG